MSDCTFVLRGTVLAVSGRRHSCRKPYTEEPFMPLYDYLCKKCGQVSELLVMGSTKPVCPHCGGRRLARQVSAPIAPGRSAAIIAAGRARAAKQGHASHYRRVNGKVVD
jgi:putative FmdB family regulatory protein